MSTQVPNTSGPGPFSQITVSRSAVAEGPIMAALNLLIKLMGFQTTEVADMAQANASAIQLSAEQQQQAASNTGAGQIAAGAFAIATGLLALGATFYTTSAESEHSETLNSLQTEKTALTTLRDKINNPVMNDEEEMAEDVGAPHDLADTVAQLKNGNFLNDDGKENTFDGTGQNGQPKQVSIQATMEAIKGNDDLNETDDHALIMKKLDDKIGELTTNLNTEAQKSGQLSGFRTTFSTTINNTGTGIGNAVQGGFTQAAGTNTMNAAIQQGVSTNMTSIMNSAQAQAQKADQTLSQDIALVTAISNSANA